jgi:hypothetical protein
MSSKSIVKQKILKFYFDADHFQFYELSKNPKKQHQTSLYGQFLLRQMRTYLTTIVLLSKNNFNRLNKIIGDFTWLNPVIKGSASKFISNIFSTFAIDLNY